MNYKSDFLYPLVRNAILRCQWVSSFIGVIMNINEEYVVEILRENNEGDGVASVNGFIVFVKGALKTGK